MAPGDKKPSCGPFIVQLSEVCVTGRRRAFSFKRVLLCAFVHTHDFLAYMFSVFYCCSSCRRIVKTACFPEVSQSSILHYTTTVPTWHYCYTVESSSCRNCKFCFVNYLKVHLTDGNAVGLSIWRSLRPVVKRRNLF